MPHRPRPLGTGLVGLTSMVGLLGMVGLSAGLVLATLSVVPAAAEPNRAGAAPSRPQGVANVAHRGASRQAPENTLAAVRRAIAADADYVGIDVRRTRNDTLVVIHDRSLARTTDVERVYPRRRPWRVSDFSLREIRRLDAGAWWSSSYSGVRVPTLAVVLRRLDRSSTGAFLEVKSPRAGTGRLVHRAIRENTRWLRPARRDRLVVQSFHRRWVRGYHRKHPAVRTSVLGHVARGRMYRFAWADQVNVPYRSVLRHPELVRAAHRHGLELTAHTVNSRRRMRQLIRRDVDGLSTDRPARLDRVLTRG